MFTPDLILGMLGVSPEDAAKLQAAIPALYHKIIETEARIRHCEEILIRMETHATALLIESVV